MNNIVQGRGKGGGGKKEMKDQGFPVLPMQCLTARMLRMEITDLYICVTLKFVHNTLL